MSLFAGLKGEEGIEIKRISLSEQVREELMENFQEAARNYIPEDGDLIINFEENINYKLEDNEVFIIMNFNIHQQLMECIKNPLVVNILTEEDYEKIKYLFSGENQENETQIIFTLFDKTKIVKADKGKFWIEYRGNTFNKVERKAIAIDIRIDALFKNRSLYFKSFRNIKLIFGNLIEKYFREATDEEIRQFTDSFFGDDVEIPNKYMDQTTRKLIWAIQRNNTGYDFTDMVNIANNKFHLQLKLRSDGKLYMPAKKRDFKRLLRLLNDDLLESPLTREKYETNSKKRFTP